MYPRQSPTTHTEQLGDEASVYDWARAQVHALNPTAACVWRQCDGATSPDAIAAALRVEMGVPEADAVVDLTLSATRAPSPAGAAGRVARRSTGNDPALAARSWRGRGDAAGDLLDRGAVSRGSAVAGAGRSDADEPLAESRHPGTTVAVTLTGTNFVAGATTVNVGGSGVTVTNVVVSSRTSLTANFVLDPAAATGARTVTVTTAAGTSGAQTFTVTSAAAGRSDADQRRAESRHPGHHGGGHADGHQFRRRRHDGDRRRWRRDGHQRRRGQQRRR